MKNLKKYLLLLIIIFPLIILLFSVFAEKSSAQSTDCRDSGGICRDDFNGKCPFGEALKSNTSECSSALSPFICCIPPTPDCGNEHQFCCGGIKGICNSGLSCNIDGVCRIPVSTSAPTPTPTPTPIPAPKFVWRQIAVCSAPSPTPTPTPTPLPTPTPTMAPAATDCTDKNGQCIRHDTCSIGQSSTKKTRQCGGELSSLICCIANPPTPTNTLTPTPTPTPTPKPASAGTTPPTATPIPTKPPSTATQCVSIVDINNLVTKYKNKDSGVKITDINDLVSEFKKNPCQSSQK